MKEYNLLRAFCYMMRILYQILVLLFVALPDEYPML